MGREEGGWIPPTKPVGKEKEALILAGETHGRKVR